MSPPTRPRIAAHPPRFEKWYNVEEDCYVLLEKEEVVTRREEEWGDQDEEAEGVGMAPMAEESGNFQEPSEDMSLRRVKQQSPTPSGDLPLEPTQKERDGSANSYDGHKQQRAVRPG